MLNSILVYNCDLLLILTIWGTCPRPTIRVVVTRNTDGVHPWRGGTDICRVPAMAIANPTIPSSSRNEASILLLSGVRGTAAALLFRPCALPLLLFPLFGPYAPDLDRGFEEIFLPKLLGNGLKAGTHATITPMFISTIDHWMMGLDSV
jgi:hypothetical protein